MLRFVEYNIVYRYAILVLNGEEGVAGMLSAGVGLLEAEEGGLFINPVMGQAIHNVEFS